MKIIITLGYWVSAALLAAGALAAPPELKTPAPVIYLADNLDEADRLGWCIDTQGRGLSDRLHAHSCKPQGGDVQFSYDRDTGQIRSVAFAGLCASYAGTLPLSLLTCEDSKAQAFVYDDKTMTFRPKGNQDTCLVVGDQSQSAGPFMSRALEIASCDKTDDLRKTWIIKP